MKTREDFGCLIPLIWIAVWIWFWTLIDNTLAQLFCSMMIVLSLSYLIKRFWHGSLTAEDMRRRADKWAEDGRTGKRPLLDVEIKEQARWKKLRELEPNLSEKEFESLKALIDAHYYGYNYKLDPLAVDHQSDGSFDSYSVSPESDERIRTAFLKHRDKFPKFEEELGH